MGRLLCQRQAKRPYLPSTEAERQSLRWLSTSSMSYRLTQNQIQMEQSVISMHQNRLIHRNYRHWNLFLPTRYTISTSRFRTKWRWSKCQSNFLRSKANRRRANMATICQRSSSLQRTMRISGPHTFFIPLLLTTKIKDGLGKETWQIEAYHFNCKGLPAFLEHQ